MNAVLSRFPSFNLYIHCMPKTHNMTENGGRIEFAHAIEFQNSSAYAKKEL